MRQAVRVSLRASGLFSRVLKHWEASLGAVGDGFFPFFMKNKDVKGLLGTLLGRQVGSFLSKGPFGRALALAKTALVVASPVEQIHSRS